MIRRLAQAALRLFHRRPAKPKYPAPAGSHGREYAKQFLDQFRSYMSDRNEDRDRPSGPKTPRGWSEID